MFVLFFLYEALPCGKSKLACFAVKNYFSPFLWSVHMEGPFNNCGPL